MSDLQSYRPSRAPLTAGARFIRGFTRIGMVLAGLVALIGLPASMYGAINNFNYSVEKHRGAQCIVRQVRSGYPFKKKSEYSSAVDYGAGGCTPTYPFEYMTVAEIAALAGAPEPTFVTSDGFSTLGVGLMITGALAVAAYVGFWLVGWLFAGFTRD